MDKHEPIAFRTQVLCYLDAVKLRTLRILVESSDSGSVPDLLRTSFNTITVLHSVIA